MCKFFSQTWLPFHHYVKSDWTVSKNTEKTRHTAIVHDACFYRLCFSIGLDWAVFYVPANTVYVIWRRFLQVKRPNQQYQSTEGTYNTQVTEKHNNRKHITKNTTNPLVYIDMGWPADGSHRGQVCHAWTVVGLPPRYPPPKSFHHYKIRDRNKITNNWQICNKYMKCFN